MEVSSVLSALIVKSYRGGGGLPGDNFDGKISEGETFATSRNPEASNTLLFLGGLRTIPVIPGGLWMVAVICWLL